jgi:hypothetical protein
MPEAWAGSNIVGWRCLWGSSNTTSVHESQGFSDLNLPVV